MTIGTDAAIEFFGTQVDLSAGTTPGAVIKDAFSVAADLDAFTNVDDAPEASVTIELEVDANAADDSGVNLYLRPLDVVSTADDEIPSATHRKVFMGFFPMVNGTTALQRSTKRIVLPNYKTSSKWEVYIENKTNQAITTTTWSVFFTPITIGPHA